MRTAAQYLTDRFDRPTVIVLNGQVVAVSAAGAVTVNIGGIDQEGINVSEVPLAVGDSVRVLRQGSSHHIIGITFPASRPISGTVASVPANSDVIVVTTTLGSISCGWAASYTPTVGHIVWIAWLGSYPVVVGRKGTTGSPPAAPPPTAPPTPRPPPAIRTGTSTFNATWSGTYRSGWLDNSISAGNVMQGDYGYGANSGAWFYSGRVRATLTGATVTAARIWLGRTYGGVYAAQTIHLCRVTNNVRPAGAPTFDVAHATDSVSLAVGQTGWFVLPVSIAQELVDSGGSIGVRALDPYVRLLGLANNGAAGALRISWRR